jgi:hypothetical protein
MRLYLAAAALLLLLGVVSVFSIGLYLIFIALVMLSVMWALGRRPHVVEGAIVGAVAAVAAHVLTAPLGCTVSVRIPGSAGRGTCARILLPDLQTVETTAANWLALAIALTVGVAAGVLVGRIARRNQIAS